MGFTALTGRAHQQLTNDQLIPQSKDTQPLPTTKIGAVGQQESKGGLHC
jgi:hypothetical protein